MYTTEKEKDSHRRNTPCPCKKPGSRKKAAAREDWASFVNRMYGALADDPIERPPQLPLTERDPID